MLILHNECQNPGPTLLDSQSVLPLLFIPFLPNLTCSYLFRLSLLFNITQLSQFYMLLEVCVSGSCPYLSIRFCLHVFPGSLKNKLKY